MSFAIPRGDTFQNPRGGCPANGSEGSAEIKGKRPAPKFFQWHKQVYKLSPCHTLQGTHVSTTVAALSQGQSRRANIFSVMI